MLKTRRHGARRMELDSSRATIDRGERVIQYFANRVSKGYSSLVREEYNSYCDCFNAVFADAQLRGEYLVEFPVTVSENGYPLHIGDTDSDEE